MNRILNAADFLEAARERVVLDVRSPGEYAQGHIPGAVSFPLFTDEERAEVGTLYKQKGKEIAMLRGLEIAGAKMADLVRQAARLAPARRVAVHCWRGGKRSQSVAWLLQTAGFDVTTLEGGYKMYRRLALETFETTTLPLRVIGGRTGSGKTKILRRLHDRGEQIIDLEALAHHKGSSFGSIGEQPQPTVEQFENDLFDVIRRLDPARPVWIENESRGIGRVFIPEQFWEKMKASPLLNVEIPEEARLQNLLADYETTDRGELEDAFRRLERKLGGQFLKAALDALAQGDTRTAAQIALRYYDKTYQHCLDVNPSPSIRFFPFDTGDPDAIAAFLMELEYAPSSRSFNPAKAAQRH